ASRSTVRSLFCDIHKMGFGQFGHGIHQLNSLKCRIFMQFGLESQLNRCSGLALAIIEELGWFHWMGTLILDILVLPTQLYLIFISHMIYLPRYCPSWKYLYA